MAKKPTPFKLKEGLLLGTATASTQIEGTYTDSNWDHWYAEGKIRDGSNPARANQHYKLYKEDIALMSSLGMQIYRMGIEWSRLEPKQGEFVEAEFDHYIDEITLLQSKGIQVLLTLHHFNNPMWFERLGGFLSPEAPTIFMNFVEKVIDKLGSLVNEYVTVNEPNVFSASAYFFEEFYPGHKNLKEAVISMTNFVKCHILAYKRIHEKRKEMGFNDTKVGYASHVRIFEPYCKWNPVHHLFAKISERFFQKSIDRAAILGKASFPIKKDSIIKPGKYADFIGINYYSRTLSRGLTDEAKPGAPKNDLGWEIYPEGIAIICKDYAKRFNAPIYITENGTCDEKDAFRAQFIYDHLKALSECGAPVEKYFHWTFIDNFEWIDGEAIRFGLVALDYETQERTVRESCKFYSEIIAKGEVTQEMIEKYL